MLLLLLPLAQAAIVSLNWTVGWVSNVNPDAAFARRAIGVNGQWPPPPISVSLNDTLVVTVINTLPVPTGKLPLMKRYIPMGSTTTTQTTWTAQPESRNAALPLAPPSFTPSPLNRPERTGSTHMWLGSMSMG